MPNHRKHFTEPEELTFPPTWWPIQWPDVLSKPRFARFTMRHNRWSVEVGDYRGVEGGLYRYAVWTIRSPADPNNPNCRVARGTADDEMDLFTILMEIAHFKRLPANSAKRRVKLVRDQQARIREHYLRIAATKE